VTTTFATIGSGRRTRFFLRLARAMPESLRVSGVVTRDPGRADALTTDWGVPAFGTVGDLLRYERPDYIAAAVPWAAMPDAIREVVGHRMPVLAETPPAPDLPGLRTLLEGLQVSEKAFSHTTEAEIADLAQRTSDLGLRLELAGPSVKPGRGGNTVASLRHLSQALCRCRSAGGSTLVEGEV
jgi:hypothetical protein